MTYKHTSEAISSPSALAGGCPQVLSSIPFRWFVLRVTYCRELKAQRLLQETGVESYIPMRCERDESGTHYQPAVHNLIFVHSSRKFLDEWKHRMEESCPLRYMMDRSTGQPMFVRDKEMADFRRVTAEIGDNIIYLDNPAAVIAKGIPVEVVSGPLKGVQGRLLRIRRDRKVVLQLSGVVAIAADGIPMACCRVIQE